MNLSNIQSPANYHSAHAQPTYFVYSSISATQAGFMYIVDVFIGTGDTLVSRHRFAPDPIHNLGVFDTRVVIPAYVSTSDPIPTTGSTFVAAWDECTEYSLRFGVALTAWAFNGVGSNGSYTQLDGLENHDFVVGENLMIQIDAGGSYATTYNGIHSVVAVPDSKSVVIDVAYAGADSNTTGRARRTSGKPIIYSGISTHNGRMMYHSAADPDRMVVINTADANFLTGIPNRTWMVRTDARLWLYAIRHPLLTQTLRIDTFKQSGQQIGSYYATNTLPNESIYGTFYSRCGGKDFSDATDLTVSFGNASVIHDDVAWYTVTYDTAGIESLTYTFVIDRGCHGNNEGVKQLLVQDQEGSFIPMILQGRHTDTLNAEKKTHKKSKNRLSPAGITTNKAYAQHKVYAVDMEQSFSANAIFRTKADAIYARDTMILAAHAYEIQDDGSLLPIVIANGSFKIKHERTSAGMIAMPITYSYAFDKPVNV